ncbi:hypothetical protein ENTCAN_09184 [Enterobacter cancerogenus ATCC 35316]|nr:hypothetical protein ENTCAN_09184 [Enterobacter cancerogenus ATCC 35316]
MALRLPGLRELIIKGFWIAANTVAAQKPTTITRWYVGFR